MKIGILQYPGGHGEHELEYVLESIYQLDVSILWYTDPSISDMDLLFLGGGFPCSEQDAAFDCRGSEELKRSLNEIASTEKIIVGIGNGFQVLCQSGLLQGKLENNPSGRFICKQVYIKADNQSNSFTSRLDQEEIFRMPIATYLGKYSANEEILVEMRQTDQIIFRFSDYQGRITESVNITGSTDNIAGVCNPGKNVFGIIPRPERYVAEVGREPRNSDILGAFLKELTP